MASAADKTWPMTCLRAMGSPASAATCTYSISDRRSAAVWGVPPVEWRNLRYRQHQVAVLRFDPAGDEQRAGIARGVTKRREHSRPHHGLDHALLVLECHELHPPHFIDAERATRGDQRRDTDFPADCTGELSDPPATEPVRLASQQPHGMRARMH